MRLDELIKYVWENMNDLFKSYGIITFYSKNGKEVAFNSDGMLQVKSLIDVLDYFEIEVEEEITEDTEFEELYTMMSFKSVYSHDAKTIKEVKESFSISGDLEFLHQIYAMVDGKLELIWERE